MLNHLGNADHRRPRKSATKRDHSVPHDPVTLGGGNTKLKVTCVASLHTSGVTLESPNRYIFSKWMPSIGASGNPSMDPNVRRIIVPYTFRIVIFRKYGMGLSEGSTSL